jgi:hypothetical protein
VAFGTLNKQQAEALRPFVEGHIVHDLGCGDMELSGEVYRLGAVEVHAIDKDPPLVHPPNGVTFHRARFIEVLEPIDVALISWPPNYECSLDLVVNRARTIIYLGMNFGGTSCGTVRLFVTLARREVLSYVPDRENVLTIYGGSIDHSRGLTGEEAAGLSQHVGQPWSYEQVLKWGS